MSKDVRIPEYIARELGELTKLNKEVLGVLTVNDREIHPDNDELVSSYLNLEVGGEGYVQGSQREDEILQEFSEQNDSQHRYFHTHPIGTLSVENSNPEEYSEGDLQTFRQNKEFYDDPEHWHMIVYYDRSNPKPGFKLITEGDWDIRFEDWEFNGKSHKQVGNEVYDDLISRGIEEVDPYEHATKII